MDLTIVGTAIASDRRVLALSGRVNAASAPELKRRVKELVASGQTHLVLDMRGVVFIDSSGLSALISGLRSAREVGGSFRIAGLGGQALAAVKLMNMDRVFELYDSVEAAAGPVG